MILQDLHTHSHYDDGHGTLREVALSAEKKGLTTVGFSGHSPLPFENTWTLTEESLHTYLADARAVKEEMAGRVEVLVGLEYDTVSRLSLEGFDYVIGSVHHVPCGDAFLCVDETIPILEEVIDRYGEAEKVMECYFERVAQIAEIDEVDIVGHFDLITKFNERKPFFDTAGPAYVAVARRAMEKLVAAGKIFEINTGAISRGYRAEPYPSRALLTELRKMGGKITVNSDSHDPGNLCFGFAEAKALAAECGFTELWQYVDGAFRPQPLSIPWGR